MSVTHVPLQIGIRNSIRIAETVQQSQPQLPHSVWSCRLKECFASALAVKCYATLMRPNKAETAVHGCHRSGDMAVRMRKVLAIPGSCVV